jgi:dTDP-glucose 4,6-dehydratase
MADDRLVLVTGAGGFIGSHLVEGLVKAGHRVRAFVRYTSHGRAGWLEELPAEISPAVEVFHGDIVDARAVLEAMRGCWRVFHLAALIGIPFSYVAPASYVSVNVNGTLNVLEAARAVGVDRVVVTSTSEVYGTACFTPITEEHPLQPQSPYSATKIAADNLALSYHLAFGLPVTVVRPFNTYGPRQSTRAVIPTVITQALYGEHIQIGSRTPVRDMVHVQDTVAGFLALADSPACIGQTTNLATGVGVTVGEMVEQIMRLVGRRLPVIESAQRRRPDTSEVFRLLGAAARASERAGWTARIGLEEGLARTIAWFRERGRPRDVACYRV